jgi:hypothetical protein
MIIVTVQLVSILYVGPCTDHSIKGLFTCASSESMANIVFYTMLFFINVVCGARAAKYLVETSSALHELVFYIDAHHFHVELAGHPARDGNTGEGSRGSEAGTPGLCDDVASAQAVNAARVKFTRGLAQHVERDPGPSLFDLVRISPNSLIAILVYVVATALSLFYKQVFHVS